MEGLRDPDTSVHLTAINPGLFLDGISPVGETPNVSGSLGSHKKANPQESRLESLCPCETRTGVASQTANAASALSQRLFVVPLRVDIALG